MPQPLVESMEVEMAEMEVEVKAPVINKNLLTGTITSTESFYLLIVSPMKNSSMIHTKMFYPFLDIRLNLVVLILPIIL